MGENELTSPFSALKWLCGLAGGMGSLIPGFAYFKNATPPLFETSSLLTGGVALAILIFTFTRKKQREVKQIKALIIILIAVFTITAYGISKRYLTVESPGNFEGPSIQTGFYLANWSLTDNAKALLDKHPDFTVEELMLAFGAYGQKGKVALIWHSWSIITAGSLLIILFSLGFLLWTYGFALLGYSISLKS